MINLKRLARFISENKMWDKPLRQLNQLEIRRLAEAFFGALEGAPPCGWTPPYIDERGRLVIPFNAPPKYRWWQGGQPLLETLDELGATEEIKAKYTPSGYGEGLIIKR
jgi:hypothetical protein